MKLPELWRMYGRPQRVRSYPYKRDDCLILNVSKSTFDLFLRYLHDRGWGQGDVQQVYDLHARYLR